MVDIAEFYNSTHKGFSCRQKSGIVYYTSPLIDGTGLAVHCFTTRIGGVSPAPFNTLNFSSKREKNRSNIQKNYEIVAGALGLDVKSFVAVNYAHSYKVIKAEEKDHGKGVFFENTLPCSDGISTSGNITTLVTLHADCLPLFFIDAKNKASVLCHAGWKGIYAHIVVKAIDFMCEQYGSGPKDIIAAVGPAIGPCCFEVQKEVYSLFHKEFGDAVLRQEKGEMYVDLWKAAVSDMQSCGLNAKNINVAEQCTHCDSENFFSHRRDKGKTGAMMALMKLL